MRTKIPKGTCQTTNLKICGKKDASHSNTGTFIILVETGNTEQQNCKQRSMNRPHIIMKNKLIKKTIEKDSSKDAEKLWHPYGSSFFFGIYGRKEKGAANE